MIRLKICTSTDVSTWGRKLFTTHRNNLNSFEEAASIATQAIHNEFRTEDGDSAFTLVRIFRLCRRDELLPELQARTNGGSGPWMTLLGTTGDTPEWCDRRQSKEHQVIGAGDNISPMFEAALTELGFGRLDQLSQAGGSLKIPDEEFAKRLFYVSQALGSPKVPDQEFVQRQGIKSVIGLGSLFASYAFYVAVLFSKVDIDAAVAEKFAELAPFVSTLLATYDAKGVLWKK